MFFCIFDPKNHENPRFCKTLQNHFPWDHAQMIERKILFRIALTRALYDQLRPYFFKNPVPNFDHPSTAKKHSENRPPGGREMFTSPVSYTHLTLPTILRV